MQPNGRQGARARVIHGQVGAKQHIHRPDLEFLAVIRDSPLRGRFIPRGSRHVERVRPPGRPVVGLLEAQARVVGNQPIEGYRRPSRVRMILVERSHFGPLSEHRGIGPDPGLRVTWFEWRPRGHCQCRGCPQTCIMAGGLARSSGTAYVARNLQNSDSDMRPARTRAGYEVGVTIGSIVLGPRTLVKSPLKTCFEMAGSECPEGNICRP